MAFSLSTTSTMAEGSNRSTGEVQTAESTDSLPLTQELVEKLTDKVLALLLEDLRNDAERYRLPSRTLEGRHSTFGTEGGR